MKLSTSSCHSWMKQNMSSSWQTVVAQCIMNVWSNILIFLIWHFGNMWKPCLSAFFFALKGEEERYTHLNAEFQRVARRDKKAFLSDQCKEREENNRMGKTRDLFKKIRDTKGTFHAKMGSIQNRNYMDLTEAEDIKRWQEYTEELCKKRSTQPR